MEEPLHRLFSESEQYLALLQGSELDTDSEESSQLLSAACAEPFLASLHLELNKAHPEAGAPYWRVRSWGLSCWQPIYLALICVYHLKLVPNNLSQLHQNLKETYVAGYSLPNGQWLSGKHETLIEHAAKQLKILFDALQEVHLKQFGGRRALYQAQLADQLIAIMVTAGAALSATRDEIKKEYKLWAKHLYLPTDLVNNLNQGAENVTFQRKTCCLHFRRDDGDLCTSCPRLNKAKQGTSCLN